ncbi:MAG: ribokinase [Actinobacteria bacterium]|nr:ribokinase [Actinomycetota bacterium]
MKKICVIGSINIDLVATMEHFPVPGEVVVCQKFNEYYGGKGANQAVGLGKLGADVSFIGKIGNDKYGDSLLKNLKKNNVKIDNVFKDNSMHSGISLIFIDSKGQNSIAHISGANGNLSLADIMKARGMLHESDIILLQLEIPLDIVFYIIENYSQGDKTIILDPAPFHSIPGNILSRISIMTPNRVEMELLTCIKIKDKNDSLKASSILLDKGVKNVINKLDNYGVLIASKDSNTFLKSIKVNAVDTVGAGDAFNAGLAFGLSHGKNLIESSEIANLIGAISVTRKGAQDSMPDISEIKRFISERCLKKFYDLF